MKREEIRDRISNILEELCGTRPTDDEVRLIGDLALDSLRLVTLLVLIEEEFGIELKECDMNPFSLITVSDVVSMIFKYVGEDDG